jgi:hypothetical protein
MPNVNLTNAGRVSNAFENALFDFIPTEKWKAANFLAKNKKMVHFGGVGALSLLAVSQAQRTYDSIRNRDVGGAMIDGALGAAAAWGAIRYNTFMKEMTEHLASRLASLPRGLVSPAEGSTVAALKSLGKPVQEEILQQTGRYIAGENAGLSQSTMDFLRRKYDEINAGNAEGVNPRLREYLESIFGNAGAGSAAPGAQAASQ